MTLGNNAVILIIEREDKAMTKLNVSKYQGFTVGVRVADKFALTARTENLLDVAALHTIKGLVYVEMLERSVQAFAVNNVLYAQ